jgi:DNA-binding MarR family transcriptional regulator
VRQEVRTEEVIEDLIKASRIFVAIAANALDDDGEALSLQQYRALALLASQEDQRAADLARALGVTPSTTTALCDRLAQKRLIHRRRRGRDRRSVYLEVSERGHAELNRVTARRGALLGKIFVRLSSERQNQLAEALPAFIDAAGEVELDQWTIRGL